MPRPTTATIHLDALRHNLQQMKARAPRSRVMAMVKADAYGHGIERVADALREADAFGVAAFEEAERVGAAGLRQPLLLLAGPNAVEDLARARQLGADCVVHDFSQIELLEGDRGAPIRCWLKLDTGMHRLGFAPGQVREAHARLAALPTVAPDIVLMNHFASSDEFAGSASEGRQTREQLRVFAEATAGLPGPRSLANSAAVLGWPESHADWIRPGGALYGMSVVAGRDGREFGLRPAMTLSSALISVKQVRRGERIGYSGTWECPEDMPVGVVAAGYGDGYPRAAAAGTPVLVDDQPARVVGRVSMDLMTVDLRGVSGARVGSLVTLWGQGLPVETVAASAGTIGYELTCSVTRRVRFVGA
jgi:alanine racemase